MKKAKEKKQEPKQIDVGRPGPSAVCWETLGGDPKTAVRLSFSIKVF